MNYHDKRFQVKSVSENGEVSSKLIFHYQQKGNILTCSYEDEQILSGQLMGLVDKDGNIEMGYHQINHQGQLMTGRCFSRPEILANGKIRLHETWEWTSGDYSKGKSVLEEI